MKSRAPKQIQFDLPKGQPAVFRQRELTDESTMPCGKWKGVIMQNVPTPYLEWFITQPWANRWPAVLAYAKNIRKIEL